MARAGLSLRERRLAALAVLVIGIGGVVMIVGWPLWDGLMQLRQQTEIARKKTAKLSELVRQRPEIERRYQGYAGLLTPETSEALLARAFLDELEQLARAARLQLNLKPRPTTRDGPVMRLAVEVEADATQDALFAFLDQVLALPSLIEIERLRMTASPSKDAPIRATLLLRKVILSK